MKSDNNRFAPEGKLWVCHACGKTAKDRYGGKDAMDMWDESCMLNSELFDESDLERNEWGYVVNIRKRA